jgi:integrase
MTQRVFEVLSNMDVRSAGSVFTYQGQAIESIKSAFTTAREKAEIENIRFHDLRHTFASRLVQADVPLYKKMHLTGHKSLRMVQWYAHLAPDYQREAFSALERLGHKKGTVAFADGIAA